MIDSIPKLIAAVIASGAVSASIAYALFTWLGKTWIEQRFAQRLEAYKHEQARQLERFRYEINSLLSRITKIHEKEFEVLPVAWEKLNNALGYVAALVARLKTYPDFDRMSQPQFEEFLATCTLADFQKEELRRATNKFQYYSEAVFWRQLADSKSHLGDFHNYIVQNRIFLSADLRDRFTEIDDVLHKALIETEIGHGGMSQELVDRASAAIREQTSSKLAEIETLVQKRLRYEEAL